MRYLEVAEVGRARESLLAAEASRSAILAGECSARKVHILEAELAEPNCLCCCL